MQRNIIGTSMLRRLLSFALVVGPAVPAAAEQLFIDPIFEVQVQEDILFANGSIGNPANGEVPLALDLYTPVDADFIKPGMLLLSGGGFENRSLDQMKPLAEQFASRGWAVATSDYRITKDDPTIEAGPFGAAADSDPLLRAMHAAFNDAAKGLKWMNDHAEELGVDPERIVIGGASSGAITALFEGYRSDSVAAIVSLSGGMYGLENLIGAGDPPVVLTHAKDDTLVPFSLAEDVVAQAEKVGVTYAFLMLDGVEHGLSPVFRPSNFAFINDFLYEQLELGPVLGDFNFNRILDTEDVILLSAEVRGGLHVTSFDLNDDQLVDQADIEFWVHELKNTWFGDANLDGEFNSGDLVEALAAGTYELDIEAGWASGDFDGNGKFDSGDLVFALADGGYEQGPRAAVAAVPEPSTALLLALAATLAVSTTRRKQF